MKNESVLEEIDNVIEMAERHLWYSGSSFDIMIRDNTRVNVICLTPVGRAGLLDKDGLFAVRIGGNAWKLMTISELKNKLISMFPDLTTYEFNVKLSIDDENESDALEMADAIMEKPT